MTVEELTAHLLAQGFLKWWVHKEFLFVRAIPKRSVGKFDKKFIRNTISQAAWRPTSSAPWARRDRRRLVELALSGKR